LFGIYNTKAVKIYVVKPSDGVVLQESSSNYKGAKYSILMPKSNHQQMRSDENTKRALFNLYNGEYRNVFKIGLK